MMAASIMIPGKKNLIYYEAMKMVIKYISHEAMKMVIKYISLNKP